MCEVLPTLALEELPDDHVGTPTAGQVVVTLNAAPAPTVLPDAVPLPFSEGMPCLNAALAVVVVLLNAASAVPDALYEDSYLTSGVMVEVSATVASTLNAVPGMARWWCHPHGTGRTWTCHTRW